MLAGFYVKRAFRIFPMLWLSLPVSVLSIVVVRKLATSDFFVEWLSRNLQTRVTPTLALLSMAGAYTRLNGPMWSLRVELAYSALMPGVAAVALMRIGRWLALAAVLCLALLPVPHEYGLSFCFSFLLGSLVTVIPRLAGRWSSLASIAGVLVVVFTRPALSTFDLPERLFDLIESGAAFFIVLDIYATNHSYRLLRARSCRWIGELSYSIYLLHLPTMIVLAVAAERFLGHGAIADHALVAPPVLGAVTACLTTLLAAATYKWVELPVQNLGRHVADRISRSGRARPFSLAARWAKS